MTLIIVGLLMILFGLNSSVFSLWFIFGFTMIVIGLFKLDDHKQI